MSVYTKKGDKGTTSTINSKKRISKASRVFEVLGTIDEANSYLGVVASQASAGLAKKIIRVQRNLFLINSIIAGAKLSTQNLEVGGMEKEIDKLERKLPKLTNFIIPGGSRSASGLMYARVLIRKSERRFVGLKTFNRRERNKIIMYLNRLSDYLFVLSRGENYKKKGVKEVIWKNS